MIPEKAIRGNTVSRRKLRVSMGSRTGRRQNTKSTKTKTKPKVLLKRLELEAISKGYTIIP